MSDLPSHKPTPAPRPYAGLSALWAAVVLVLTLTPAQNMPITPAWELLSFDTAAHAGVFALLAGLSWFSLSRQRRWSRLARHAGWAVLVGTIFFGGLIEILQHAMHLGRHGDWTDLLSDAIGAAIAVGLIAFWNRRGRRWVRTLVPLVFWAGMASVLPGQAQDMPRVRRTIAKLASPQLHGRGYVKDGDKKAAAYLRGRLQELKLEPLAPDYTQPFTLDVNTFPGKLNLKFQIPSGYFFGHTSYRYTSYKVGSAGSNYIAAATSGGGSAIKMPVFFLDSSCLARPRYVDSIMRAPARTQAVMLSGRTAAQLRDWPANIRQYVDSCAVWLKCVPKLTATLASQQRRRVDLELLTPLVYHFEKTPPHAVPLPFFPGQTVTFSVDAQLRRDYQTQNLAAVIRGTAQPDSFLVVTAHYDHLGRMGKHAYFPGANDNASGVALLLELAAHYVRPENQPSYSVVFLLFGAEEAGLLGSSYFVAHPLVPLPNIKFLVNLDLLGTGEQGATVVNGRVLEAPYRRLVSLNDAHRYLPALGARGRAANSDHFPFSEAGVPAFFLYTRGGSAAYHDVNDRPAALSLAGFAGAFGLVRDFLNELGAAKQAVRQK